MKKLLSLVLIFSLCLAFLSAGFFGCSSEEKVFTGKKKQQWRTKGNKTVNPELGKLR
jgi:hypothetical protein